MQLRALWRTIVRHGLYRSKPFRYVSHILGHEGEGSLLSLLKRRGWADELMAGENQSHSDFATFGVTITLTDLGNAHIDELVPLVFSCVAMIRSASPPPKWVFDEIGGVSRMRLRCSGRRATSRPQPGSMRKRRGEGWWKRTRYLSSASLPTLSQELSTPSSLPRC